MLITGPVDSKPSSDVAMLMTHSGYSAVLSKYLGSATWLQYSNSELFGVSEQTLIQSRSVYLISVPRSGRVTAKRHKFGYLWPRYPYSGMAYGRKGREVFDSKLLEKRGYSGMLRLSRSMAREMFSLQQRHSASSKCRRNGDCEPRRPRPNNSNIRVNTHTQSSCHSALGQGLAEDRQISARTPRIALIAC